MTKDDSQSGNNGTPSRDDSVLEDSGTAIGWEQLEDGEAETVVQDGMIGQYEIVEQLGDGGMGQVFLARQLRPIKRSVALKLMSAGVSSERLLRRFEAERQALALMNHPNIAHVYDAGSTGSGAPYFVMEYVEGEPITSYCNRRGLDIRARLELFLQVCDGVTHAHQKGVIHRDLKPTNVLVAGNDEPVPKIIDFGIAKAMDEPLIDKTLITGNWMIGTPTYMAPEQFRRDGEGDIDIRADIYSLGVVLYELMVDTLPYSFKTGETAYELASRILEEEPPPPSTMVAEAGSTERTEHGERLMTEPLTIRKQLRGDLDWITLKAMEKDRSRRYDSVAELAADIRRHLDHQPVLAGPPSARYRLGKFVRRNARMLAVTGVALLALLAMAALSVRAQLRARERQALAQEFGQQVQAMESLMRIAHLTPRHDVSREKGIIRERMGRLEERLGFLGSIAEGPGNYALGRGHLALGEIDEARDRLSRAWESAYREPEVAYALALTLSDLYGRHHAAAQRIRDEEQREQRMQELHREYRDPAVEFAALSEGVELESPAFLEAQVAVLEERYDDALAKARTAYERVPWLYEARTLEGRVYLLIASESVFKRTDDDPHELAARSVKALQSAALVGQSAPQVYESLCAAVSLQLKMETYGRARADVVMTHFEDGMTACRQALEVDPERRPARLGMLELLLRTGEYEMNAGIDPGPRFEAAQEVVRGALRLGSQDASFYKSVGRTQLYLTYYLSRRSEDIRSHADAAIQALEKALALNDQDHSSLNNLALVYYLKAEAEGSRGEDPRPTLQRAISSFERSIELEPNAVYSLNNLGDALRFLAQEQWSHGEDPEQTLKRAIEAHRRAAEVKADHVDAWMDGAADHELLGKYRSSRGGDPAPDLDAALELLDTALELKADGWEAHRNLADVHRTRAHYEWLVGTDPRESTEQAIAAYQRSFEANPTIYPGPQGVADSLILQARYELELGLDPNPSLRRSDDWNDRALELEPSQATPYFQRAEQQIIEARWRMRQGQDPGRHFERARDELEEARELGGEENAHAAVAGLERWRAEWLLQQGRPATEEIAGGFEHIANALGVNPESASSWQLQGELYLLRARAETDSRQAHEAAAEAVESLERAIEINSNRTRLCSPFLAEARGYLEDGQSQ